MKFLNIIPNDDYFVENLLFGDISKRRHFGQVYRLGHQVFPPKADPPQAGILDIRCMNSLYSLKSLRNLGYYIGITDNEEDRLKQHNSGKTKSIKHGIPFTLVYSEECKNKREARKREIRLKKNCQIRKELLSELGLDMK